MDNKKKIGIIAGAAMVAAVGGAALIGSGVSANAAPAPAATASASAKAGGQADRTANQAANHTEVTGDEATKVGDAVKAKDSAVTVTKVLKDADGSYDVEGTKNGSNVRYEVSADLSTITEGQMGGKGGPGGSQDTPVTGDEATKVGDAVKAKDSAVTVESVRKDPDGSYDVLGTKAGQKVMFDVSADLATITQAQGR